MKKKKVVHIKNEKVLLDKNSRRREVTELELRKSAHKTEQSTMIRSKISNSITFVEME
jgi:hypothetical protein